MIFSQYLSGRIKNLYFDTVSKYLSEEADKSDLIIKIIMIVG